MYEQTLHAAERILSSRTNGSLRVTELWDAIGKATRNGDCDECTLADFAALLDADPRFELLNSDRAEDEVDDEVEGADEDLRSLGFLKAAIVRLKRKKVVLEDDGEDIPSLPLRHLSETSAPKGHPRVGESKTTHSKRGRPASTRPVGKRGSGRSR